MERYVYIYIYIHVQLYGACTCLYREIFIERYVNTCVDTYLVQVYGSYVKGEQGTIIKKVVIKSYYY